MKILLFLCILANAAEIRARVAWAYAQAEPAPVKKSGPALPAGCVEYKSDGWTQEIAVTNGYDRITPVPVSSLDPKWSANGGLHGITGWKSRKFRLIPDGKHVQTWIGDIQVLNSMGYYQPNRGILRRYPNGTEFHELLSNEAGQVFEHRVRRKQDGKWLSAVEYVDESARPAGYVGVKQSCNSCHSEAGSGGYGTGLVPGGDTILSDPLDWRLIRSAPRQIQPEVFRPPVMRFSGSC